MMNRTDIKEFARGVFKKNRRPKNPQLMHPNREWVIGLFIALVIFTLPAIWSAQTYLKYREVSVEAVQSDNTSNIVYRESLVNAALETFSEKGSVVDSILYDASFVMPEVVVEAVSTSTENGDLEETDISEVATSSIEVSTTTNTVTE